MTKLGAHVVGGSRNGFQGFCQARPAVVLAVNEGGALQEAKTESGGHTTTIFRDVKIYRDAPDGIDQADPRSAIQMANNLWPALRSIWRRNPADYYTCLNEPGAHNRAVMPNYLAYERRMMELAEAEGFRLCCLNLAWGTPDDGRVAGGEPNGGIETWKQVYVPHIARAYQGGHIYGRHEYGLQSGPGTGRGGQEAAYLRRVGLHGGICFTELGFNSGSPFIGVDDFIRLATAFDAVMQQHSNELGGCLWTLGEWARANWQDAIPPLSQYMREHPSPKWTPGPSAPPPQPTPQPPGPGTIARLTARYNLRLAPHFDDTRMLTAPRGTRLLLVRKVQGAAWRGNDEWYEATLYVHSSGVEA